MALRSLTRLFTNLTSNRPNLTRELVTPHLPAVFQALLALLNSSDLLEIALESLCSLVAAHPVTFRPFVNKTRVALLRILSSGHSEETTRTARELWVSLHLCASNKGKQHSHGNAPANEWRDTLVAVIEDAHATLDILFTPITEEYHFKPVNMTGAKLALEEDIDNFERLQLLLKMTGSFFTTPTTAQPQVPLPLVTDLAARILAVTGSATTNPAIERSHRELLMARLPELHATALDLLTTISSRLGSLVLPFAAGLAEQASFVFSETPCASVRVAVYILLNSLLTLSGPSLTKPTLDSLLPVLNGLCDDLLPLAPILANKTATADSLMSAMVHTAFAPPALVPAASALLVAALSKLPPHHLRTELRAKLERTAIITGNKPALLAAVLFPRAAARSGVLPHLVRSGVSPEVEAVVRPRMPVVWTGPTKAEVLRQLREDEERRLEAAAEAAAENDSDADSDSEDERMQDAPIRSHKRPRTDGQQQVRFAASPAVSKPMTAPAKAPHPFINNPHLAAVPSLAELAKTPPLATGANGQPAFFSQILQPVVKASNSISPEKVVREDTQTTRLEVTHGIEEGMVVISKNELATGTASAVSPEKPFGDGSEKQLVAEMTAPVSAAEDSDEEMQGLELVMGGDSDSDDE